MQNELLQGAISSMRRPRRRHGSHGTAAARRVDMPAVALPFPCDRPCGYPVRTRAIAPQSWRLSDRKNSGSRPTPTPLETPIGVLFRARVIKAATMGQRWGENKTSYRWRVFWARSLLLG